ncbi:MurR/RpiR family transcriptional regulator [Alkalicoccus chagannorensis]|uniref:MurR/RpiR family transcriptional regulator n=1 Tax=Alkalicoccus chagannorensis TaxID=427072 RepID=UPI0004298DFD|nr:MurR/RpiR family transcriptional regulator [Alkalicoccus chagannorensis]
MKKEETSHCLSRIRGMYQSLRSKEKAVADYVLAHPEEIVHSTITQTAERIGVSEASVFRFCQSIGFKGYQALKIALASELVTGTENIHEAINADDAPKVMAEKVFQSNIRTLEETISLLDEEAFEAAAGMLLRARRIEFYGNGGSGAVALDAHHKFLRSGMPSTVYTDSHLQVMSASQLQPDDVVVLVSHSGTNKDILEAADIAKENGAGIIAITNFAKSPLSEKADVVLRTISMETDYRSEALASRIAQLSLIDALYIHLSVVRQEQMEQSLDKMRRAISLKRM